MERHGAELGRLGRLLSQTLGCVAVDRAVIERAEAYRSLQPEAAARLRPRHADMPYRVLLYLMRARVQAAARGHAGGYANAAELAADLALVGASLRANRGEHAGLFRVRRLERRVQTFGFHLARLDVRQHAGVHARDVAQALGDSGWTERDAQSQALALAPYAAGSRRLAQAATGEVAGVAAVFRVLAATRQRGDAAAIGAYVISMSRSAADVLAVLALARARRPGRGRPRAARHRAAVRNRGRPARGAARPCGSLLDDPV